MASGTTPAGRGTVAAAFVAATATFAGYMVGAGRAYSYDAALTMHAFVTGSLADVFTKQIILNNHPLLSLVEHTVWLVTGSAEEVTMRIAPAAFAATAVGLFVWRVGRRWGVVAGVAGALVLATHPTLASALQRDVRGYTLAALAVVVMGIAVLDVNRPAMFAVALAVGIGAHLYAAVAALALLVWSYVSGRLDRRWRRAAVIGYGAGFAVYAGIALQMGRRGNQVRLFRPRFPVDAGWELLGGSAVAVVALVTMVVIVRRRLPTAAAAGIAALLLVGVVVPWLLAPFDLYPRFVYFAVPALALGVSAAVWIRRGTAVLALVAAVAMVGAEAGTWAKDEIPNRELARVASGRVCGVGFLIDALFIYEPGIVRGKNCPTAALLMPGDVPAEARQARARWPVVCWSIKNAAVLARTADDCPPAARGASSS